MKRIGVVFLLGVSSFLFAPFQASAQIAAGVEQIDSYGVDINIQKNSDLVVQETIAYDFAYTQHHGIERFIPVEYPKNALHHRVTPLEILSVKTDTGTPANYRTYRSGSNEVIRVGDPNTLISGKHVYQLTYRVKGALNSFSDHDELYWNATGDQWVVPMSNVSVNVHAPADITQIACYEGSHGSQLPCQHQIKDGKSARFSQEFHPLQQGVTVVIGLPKNGVVPAPKPIYESSVPLFRKFAVTPQIFIGIAAVSLLMVRLIIFLLRKGRDRRYKGSAVDVAFNKQGADETVPLFAHGEIPVEFVPPDNLRPGLIGTLVDDNAQPLDVTATIIDLAVRGFLTITEIEKKGSHSKPDWTLTWTGRKNADELLPYERKLVDAVFKGKEEVELSKLKDHFATHLREVQDELYEAVVKNGWYKERPDKARRRWRTIGIALAVFGIGLFWIVTASSRAGLVVLPVPIAGLIIFTLAKRMPVRTAKGTGARQRILGFRRFIMESEKRRAEFAEKKNLFSEYLPYAVVFGATEKWAKTFAGLDGGEPDIGNWYRSTQALSLIYFASAIDNFSTQSVGTLVSTPASSGSSGFSSSGFSGGGMGGGGGGSW